MTDVVIIGGGPGGYEAALVGSQLGGQVTLIDTDTEMIDVAGEFGSKVWFGDGTRIDLLRQAAALLGRS